MIVDDASDYMTREVIDKAVKAEGDGISVVRVSSCGVTGRLKNLGVYWSEKMFGRGEYLYVMDNDGYYTEGWDQHIVKCLDYTSVRLVGPYKHPYHQTNWPALPLDLDQQYSFHPTDAVQGIGHFMAWETWDKYGPLDAHAIGTNQSEDYAFCRKIVDDGYLVGSIQPEVVHNCGFTGTNGKPSPGAEVMTRIPGIYME